MDTLQTTSLYDLHQQVAAKQLQLATLEDEINVLKWRKKELEVKQRLENVTTLHKSIIDSQRNINGKKTATVQKLQRDSTISAEKENISLPHRYHQDFKDVVVSIRDVKTLLSKIKPNQYDAAEKHMSIMSSLCKDYNKQLANDVHNFKTCKDLYDNILLLNRYKAKETGEVSGDKESLGCRPVDESSTSLSVNSIGHDVETTQGDRE